MHALESALIDAHALYNVPTAVRLATRLAPYAITWFENTWTGGISELKKIATLAETF